MQTAYQPTDSVPVMVENSLPRVLFDNLRRLAKVLVDTLGNQCEVVIHDLSDLEHSIVWIEGDVTGRQVGGSLTDLGIQKVRDGDTRDLSNYQTEAPDGRTLKSSSVFLHDAGGEVIGAFCINWDISALVAAEQVLNNLMHTATDEALEETFVDDVSEILDTMIETCVMEAGKPLALMEKTEKVDLIDALDRRGAFQLKRAVPAVARRLGVSRQTVYNYLDEARSSDGV